MTENTPQKSSWRHLPNGLTILRLVSIPIIIYLSLHDHHGWALLVFALGVLTDIFDGFLARTFGWKTHAGSMLDPVADKLFVLCLIPLLWRWGAISQVFTLLVVVRYLVQLSAFPVLGLMKRPFKVAPKFVPKLATAVAYAVLGMGFALHLVIDWLPDTSASEIFFERTLKTLTFVGCVLEIWVLVTFLPRYVQIIRGKEDTFE